MPFIIFKLILYLHNIIRITLLYVLLLCILVSVSVKTNILRSNRCNVVTLQRVLIFWVEVVLYPCMWITFSNCSFPFIPIVEYEDIHFHFCQVTNFSELQPLFLKPSDFLVLMCYFIFCSLLTNPFHLALPKKELFIKTYLNYSCYHANIVDFKMRSSTVSSILSGAFKATRLEAGRVPVQQLCCQSSCPIKLGMTFKVGWGRRTECPYLLCTSPAVEPVCSILGWVCLCVMTLARLSLA